MNTQQSLDRIFEEIAPKIEVPPVSEIRNGSELRGLQRVRAQRLGVTLAISVVAVFAFATLAGDEPSSLATGAEDGGVLVEVDPAEEQVGQDDGVASGERVPITMGPEFFDSLQRGRWKLAEGSDTFPDRDVAEQGIYFWTQVEPGDRVGFYGQGCFASDAFLHWNEPGVASVVPDETGVTRLPMLCDASPGIANHPPMIGSSLHVDLEGNFIEVTLYDPGGVEKWNARFEYHQYHILEDQ